MRELLATVLLGGHTEAKLRRRLCGLVSRSRGFFQGRRPECHNLSSLLFRRKDNEHSQTSMVREDRSYPSRDRSRHTYRHRRSLESPPGVSLGRSSTSRHLVPASSLPPKINWQANRDPLEKPGWAYAAYHHDDLNCHFSHPLHPLYNPHH